MDKLVILIFKPLTALTCMIKIDMLLNKGRCV